MFILYLYKVKLKQSILLISLFLFTARGYSQDTLFNPEIEQQLETISELTENEDSDFTALLDQLSYFKEHPINLNYTSREELQELQLLNDIQIYQLLHHIENNGKLISIYELQSVAGFSLPVINSILPYVKVSTIFEPINFSELFKKGNHLFYLRYGQILEKQNGFQPIDSASLYQSKNSRYIGSPQKIYARYRFTFGNRVSVGFTADKDQGELLLKNRQTFKYNWYESSLNGNQHNGFDFYSAHLLIQNVGIIKTFAIGDYNVTFGQGLTLWSGYSFGKSSNVYSIKKVATGITAYTSSDENNFLRGNAGTFQYKKLKLSYFVSRKKIDANIKDTLSDGGVKNISSFQTSGYHSTASEIYDKDAVTQTLQGGNISYKGKRLSLGITAVNFLLNKELIPNNSYYKQFDFSGKHNFNAGIDYNFVIKNLNFFGEQSIGKNGAIAMLNGALISLDPRLSIIIVHRNYPRNYQNLMSNAISENTNASNEKGSYVGISVQANNKLSIDAYYDRFLFPWLNYQVNAPSIGYDYNVQLKYSPSKKAMAYFRVKHRNKQKNESDKDVNLKALRIINQVNYRFQISYMVSPSIQLKNRIELIDYKEENQPTEKGILLYQDVKFQKPSTPFSLSLRYTIFQTDSYNSRIYAYENDVASSYSIPSYYNKGVRFYIICKYQLIHNLALSIRYSQTYYDHLSVISPGSLNEINGNTRSEVKALLSLKF